MREYIIADNQDISKAGMMFLLSKQKDVATLLEADNKAELIQQLRLYPQAVVVLDYTLFDFAGQMIAVEWLIIPVCHKQGLPERIQQRDFPDIRAGIMDEYARLHIAVGIDMAIVPSACNAAAYKLSIILEVHGIDWLATFHCPDFPYPVVHVLSLLLRWKKFRRRIVSHRHIMEEPCK